MGKGFALLFEQGCGKTLTAVGIVGKLYTEGRARRCLVVAPLSVCPVWPREIEEYSEIGATVQCVPDMRRRAFETFCAGLPGRRLDGIHVIVTNYESLRGGKLFDAICAWQPEIVICDESQRIKNPKALQTKRCHVLGDIAKYRLILTGTPVCNTPLDFWAQYRFLDPTVFGTSYYAFRNRYAILGGYEKHEVLGIRKLGELSAKAHSIAARVTKAEALDLPPYITQTFFVELEPEARAVYDVVRETGALEILGRQLNAPEVITRMLRLAQITGGFLPEVDGITKRVSWAKLNVCREIVGDLLGAGHKVVIFARFTAEIRALREVMIDLVNDDAEPGRSRASRVRDERAESFVAMIDGSVSGAARGEEVERFQTDPLCKVFIAQTRTAGLGITLHAADTCIFYSPDFSYADYAQARDRIHRVGQDKPCTCVHLCARDTIDELAFSAIEGKKGLADNALDTWREVFKWDVQ